MFGPFSKFSFFLTMIFTSQALNFGEWKNKTKHKDKNGEEVVLLHVLFRHGERTRDFKTYPNDPYKNYDFFPYGYGQLTNIGKNREYNIGKYLRKRYDKFLGDLYYPEVLDASATSFNRTKMSVELVLASLFPPVGQNVWLASLSWQPIPYNIWEKKNGFVLGDVNEYCPTFRSELNKYLSTKEGTEKYLKDDLTLYNYLSKYTGENMTNPEGPNALYFMLATEEEWGLELPSWTKNVWPNDITNVAIKLYTMYTATKNLTKLTTGFFLKKIIEDTIAKVEGKLVPKNRKIFLYSAHELNIGLVLNALGIYDQLLIPPYGSFVIFEVIKSNDSYGMKIYYQNYREDEPKLMQLPSCSEICDIRRFQALYYDLLPTSEKVCQNYR